MSKRKLLYERDMREGRKGPEDRNASDKCIGKDAKAGGWVRGMDGVGSATQSRWCYHSQMMDVE